MSAWLKKIKFFDRFNRPRWGPLNGPYNTDFWHTPPKNRQLILPYFDLNYTNSNP